jgi:hypothetical protein
MPFDEFCNIAATYLFRFDDKWPIFFENKLNYEIF